MKALLDTQLLIWAMVQPRQLSSESRDLIEDRSNQLFYSSVSIWEVAIKSSIGRRDLNVNPAIFRRALIDNGYVELPVTGFHALGVTSLPPIHKDPFDRLLIAQATLEGMWLFTTDSLIIQYPGPIRKVT